MGFLLWVFRFGRKISSLYISIYTVRTREENKSLICTKEIGNNRRGGRNF